MSRANVETVRRMYDAFHAGDADGALSHFSADVLVDTGSARPDLSVGRGREYLASVVAGWTSAFEDWRDEVADIRDLGEEVLVLSVQRGRGKGSGVEVEARYAILYGVSGGAITRVRMYGSVQDAVEAAGASEMQR
jgi:ketosteroid isomerase-like protein